MNRAKVIILVCFVTAFAIGVGTGTASRRLMKRPDRESWLTRELGLTQEQQEKMKEIWSTAGMEGVRQWREKRIALGRERDEAMQGLLSEEQKAQYQAIVKSYEEKVAALEKEAAESFEAMVAKTKEILTDEQKAKYDAFLSRGPRPGQPGGPGRGLGGPGGGRGGFRDRGMPPEAGEQHADDEEQG